TRRSCGWCNVRLAYPDDQQRHREKRGNDGHPKDKPEVVTRHRHESHREQRSDERTDGIERLTQPITSAAKRGRREVAHKRVARCTANPLPYAINEPCGKDPPNRRREREKRLRHCRQPIPERREDLSLAEVVAQRAGEDLDDGRRRLCNALYEPERKRPST